MNKVVISVLGQDRPGILAAVSKILFDMDCNIENVSQTILQTEFAGTFIASLPAQTGLQALARRLESGLGPMDLHVSVRALEHPRPYFPAVDAQPFIITAIGPDRKGLVARITEIIARHGVNVTNLQAVFKGGDEPGDNIMIYEVDIPATCDTRLLRQELKARAEALDLDISIQHRNIFQTINRI
jgi:glycine cleavage system transcriptional repressor